MLGWLIVSVIADAIVKKLVPAQGREIERSGTVEMGVIDCTGPFLARMMVWDLL